MQLNLIFIKVFGSQPDNNAEDGSAGGDELGRSRFNGFYISKSLSKVTTTSENQRQFESHN